jgi:hypothetical protein
MTVAFEGLTETSFDAPAVTTVTVNATSAGTNRLAVIWIFSGAAMGGATVTVGGDAATLITTGVGNMSTWYYLSPPTASTAYVAVMPNLSRGAMRVVTFSGVRQSSPIRTSTSASGSTTQPTVTVVTQDGDMLVDGVQQATNQDFVEGAGQTERADAFYANDAFRYASSTEPATSASVVMDWTVAASVAWVIWGLSVANLAATPNQVSWFFSKMRDFYRDLRAGLIPPHELRKRYGELITI